MLPKKSHRQRSLVGYSPWGHRVRHNWATEHALITYMHAELKSKILEGIKWNALLWNTLYAKRSTFGGREVMVVMYKEWWIETDNLRYHTYIHEIMSLGLVTKVVFLFQKGNRTHDYSLIKMKSIWSVYSISKRSFLGDTPSLWDTHYNLISLKVVNQFESRKMAKDEA